MKIRPKDPCPCQSGKEYRYCHMIRNAYKPNKRIIFDKKKYVNDWQIDTEYFNKQGYYNWMANCLFEKVNPESILDIGCGNGNGIIELLKNDNVKFITSIEENEYCIDNAYKKLSEKGINVNIIKRNDYVFKNQGFEVNYTEIDNFESARVNIIQGDITHDKILHDHLIRQKFDAITCWLIGSHDSIYEYNDYMKAGVLNFSHYQMIVHKQIFKLADIILNPKGFFHIVDRNEVPYASDIMQPLVKYYNNLSAFSNMKLYGDIKYLEYKPVENGIQMPIFKNPLIERKSEFKGFALISILSMK